MLRYLLEQVKAGLEPFGIGIILAQIKVRYEFMIHESVL